MFLKRVPRTVEIRYVSYIKYVRRKRDYVQRSHRHAVFGHEFVYVDYGEVNVTIGKETFLLKAGDAILIKGGTWHTHALQLFQQHVPGQGPGIVQQNCIVGNRFELERNIPKN